MANSLNINVSGVWKQPTPKINVAGTWKSADSVWVNVSGVWKQIYSAAAVNIQGHAGIYASSVSPTDAVAQYRVESGGLEASNDGTGWSTIGTWLFSGAASDYEVRFTVTAGSTPTGSATSTWLNMGTTRFWAITDTTTIGGAVTCTATVEVRLAASPFTVLDTASVFLSANKSA